MMSKTAMLFATICLVLSGSIREVNAQSAKEIVEKSGIEGGVVVHVGCGDGKLTSALRLNDSYLVHGLDSDPAKVSAARDSIRKSGRYGKISIDTFDGRLLPYIDNSINLIVVSEGQKVEESEITRVLAPRGVAMIASRKISKPVPDEIDDWSHQRQGPENNPVARDTAVGPPRHMQWVVGPRWLRSHEVPSGITTMITAGGRIFYTLDEGPIGIVDGRFPEKWSLVARDAFNGTLLWKIKLPKWGWQTWRSSLSKAKMIDVRGLRTTTPSVYASRMVADGERLYFTLGNKAAVSIIDAATGKVIAECPDSDSPSKLILSDGVLIALLDKRIAAFDCRTGKSLWKKQMSKPSLAASGSRLVYHTGSKDIECLDIKSGKSVWKGELSVAGELMISDGTILSVAGTTMHTLSLESGKTIWTNAKKGAKKGRRRGKSEIYIIGDTIWSGYRGQRFDLKSGKKLPELGVKNLWSPQHHHR